MHGVIQRMGETLAAGLRALEDYPERYRELATFEYTGDSCIIDPRGEVIAGPLYGAEGIVIADCDLRVGLHAKRLFDATGHYGREDALLPLFASDGAGPVTASAEEPA